MHSASLSGKPVCVEQVFYAGLHANQSITLKMKYRINEYIYIYIYIYISWETYDETKKKLHTNITKFEASKLKKEKTSIKIKHHTYLVYKVEFEDINDGQYYINLTVVLE